LPADEPLGITRFRPGSTEFKFALTVHKEAEILQTRTTPVKLFHDS